MQVLLEWVGTLALLGLLLLFVPVLFMLIVTLQFRLTQSKDEEEFRRLRERGRTSRPS